MSIYIPLMIVVLSNTLYHICAKATPQAVDTFASLTVTYAVGAAFSLILFFVTRRGGGALAAFQQLNWTSFALGAAIVGLEAGFLLMYKTGWNIGTAQLVASALLAVVLLVVGALAYKETITLKKALGVAVCLAGLYLLK